MQDPHAEVVSELLDLKEEFYAAIKDAADAGLPVDRIIGLVGFSNARYILGDKVQHRGNHSPKPVPRASGASPLSMPARRTA